MSLTRSHFTELADELILAILNHLEESDILRLRSSSRKLSDICDGPLQNRRHRLYLHPLSIYQAIQICADPAWSKDIAEIVILGNSEPSMQTREVIHFPDFLLDYHPWSQFPPTAEGERELNYEELVAAQSNTFEQNYADLIEGLKALPALRTIRYSGSVCEPGFCGVSLTSIIAHAKQRDLWRYSFGSDDQPPMRWALRTVWWSDAEVLTGIMAALPSTFSRVDIQQPMPAVKRYSRTQLDNTGTIGCRQDPAFRTSRLGDCVTTVSIPVPGQHGWQTFLRHILSDMVNLKNLTINIISRIDEHDSPFSQRFTANRHQILWEEELSRASRFDPGRLASSAPLQSLTIRSPSSYPYSLHGLSVLHQFTNTLRKLELFNIVLYSTTHPDHGLPIGIREPIKSAVAHMKRMPNMESACFVVPRPPCAAGCAFESTNQHLAQCFIWPVENAFVHLEVFEELAMELDVPIRDDGTWDFAAHVCDKL